MDAAGIVGKVVPAAKFAWVGHACLAAETPSPVARATLVRAAIFVKAAYARHVIINAPQEISSVVQQTIIIINYARQIAMVAGFGEIVSNAMLAMFVDPSTKKPSVVKKGIGMRIRCVNKGLSIEKIDKI